MVLCTIVHQSRRTRIQKTPHCNAQCSHGCSGSNATKKLERLQLRSGQCELTTKVQAIGYQKQTKRKLQSTKEQQTKQFASNQTTPMTIKQALCKDNLKTFPKQCTWNNPLQEDSLRFCLSRTHSCCNHCNGLGIHLKQRFIHR